MVAMTPGDGEPQTDEYEEDANGEDPFDDFLGDDEERRETPRAYGHRRHSKLSLDETARLVRARAHLIMERIRQPTLPGISLDAATATVRMDDGGQRPDRASPQGINITRPSPRPQRDEKLLLQIGCYLIERVTGDYIVVCGKGQSTGKRYIPIASLERVEGADGTYVWCFKEGAARAFASFQPAD